MAVVVHKYERDPALVAEREAAAKMREAAAKRKEAAKAAASRSTWRGMAGLRKEKTGYERVRRLEKEMLIAVRRGELVEKEVVLKQAAFLLTALRQRCLAAPSAWSRRLLNISDPRQMSEQLRQMMNELLEELADLPQKVTNPAAVGDEDGNAFRG